MAGVVVLFAVGSTVAFDSEHPKFTSIYYRAAADGATVWQSVDQVDDYTRPFLGEYPTRLVLPEYFPQLGSRLTCRGARAGLRPGQRRRSGCSRTSPSATAARCACALRSERGAAVLSLLVHTVVGNLSASVDGHELGGRDTTLLDGSTVRWSFDFYAPPPEGVVVTLDFAAGPRVLLRAVDFTYGLPAGAAGRVPGPAGRHAPGPARRRHAHRDDAAPARHGPLTARAAVLRESPASTPRRPTPRTCVRPRGTGRPGSGRTARAGRRWPGSAGRSRR